MTAPIRNAFPSIDHPFVGRRRQLTETFYPYVKELYRYAKQLSTGELIIDGALIARHMAADSITATAIAADAVTADAMAANSITAANAAIATATVDTLQIAGNAVTQAVSASAPTQVGFSSASYSSLASVSMSVTGSQPVFVWGSMSVSGAESVASPGDYSYDGLFWQTNASTSYLTMRAAVGASSSNEIEEFSVLAGETLPVPFAFLFASPSAGTQTVKIEAKKTSGSGVGIRDVTIAALEVKR